MVKLFTKPNCPDCIFMKRYLDMKNIQYTVESIMDNLSLMAQFNIQSAPAIQIADKVYPAKQANVAFIAKELQNV